MHLNSRDLRSANKMQELEHLVNLTNLDAICVSETFLKAHEIQVYSLPGYSHHATVRSFAVEAAYLYSSTNRLRSLIVIDMTLRMNRCSLSSVTLKEERLEPVL